MEVLKPGRHLDLPSEPLGAERGRKLRAEDLHRYLSVVLQVLGEVHRGHAALPELALDAVAADESFPQSGHRLVHGSVWLS